MGKSIKFGVLSYKDFMPAIVLLYIILFSPSYHLIAQKEVFYRIRADFSIKEKGTDGKSSLTMGQVFYDKLKKKIVYNIRFPEKEVWLFKDSLMYKTIGQKVEKKPLVPGYIEFSIFNLALNNNLKDYGLKNTMFSLKEVIKEGEMIISTWEPKKEMNSILGEIRISIVKNRLHGVIFYNPKKKIIGKQIFSNYITIKGFEFPSEIVHFAYLENGNEIHQMTTFKNIRINDWAEASFYDLAVPE